MKRAFARLEIAHLNEILRLPEGIKVQGARISEDNISIVLFLTDETLPSDDSGVPGEIALR